MVERRNLAMYARAVLPSLVFIIVVCSLMGIADVKSVARGDWTPVIALGVALAFAAVMVAVIVPRQRARLRSALQAPTPDAAVRFVEDTHVKAARLPGVGAARAEASAAAQLGLVYACYGEFDRVRQVLAAVSWQALPPALAATEPGLRSILALLEARDPQQALDLARRANGMSRVPDAVPVARRANAAWDAYVRIAEALTETEAQARDAAAALERYAAKGGGLGHPVLLWGLAAAHRRLGARDRARDYEAQLRAAAPHCRGLLDALALGERE